MKIPKYFSFAIIFFIFIFVFLPQQTQASFSADMYAKKGNMCADLFFDVKKYVTIQKILREYNSPIFNESHVFIRTCKKNNFDCYLLPSIAGIESLFGRYVMLNSYNPFGWGQGRIIFSSWKQSIEIVGLNLKKNYIDKGYVTTLEISSRYAPDSNTWHNNVEYFKKKLYNEEIKISTFFSIINSM